jgi:hypothetical protein
MGWWEKMTIIVKFIIKLKSSIAQIEFSYFSAVDLS